MFDPLDHPGLPIDRHGRHWHELDLGPVDARATDPYTRSRISTMEALETAAALFDRRFTRRSPDADARRSLGSLGESASERRHHIAALHPQAENALEDAIGYERAALDLVTWVARTEPDPERSSAYREQAWRHLERLRSYAELGDRAGFGWADRIAREVEDLWPASATGSTAMPRSRPWPPAPPAVTVTQPMMTQPMMTQPMSLLYDWAVQAAHQQTARHSGVVRRLLASMTGPERGGNRAPEQRRGGRRPGTGEGSWEQLVVHESAACYLYYSFLAEETDRQLRPLWELHLQMELAHLRAAGDLLRRYDGRDPREVTGTGLPEPVTLESNGRYLWRLIPDDAEDAGEAGSGDVAQAGDPGGRPDREQDLVDVLTQQHERIDDLFQRVIRAEGDEKHTAFGELAQVLAVHEVVEEEVVHPLTRRLDPDGHLADRMLDEERQISDALADAVRADAAGDPGEAIGALRDMVLAHAWSEERLEFPRLRAAVPADERREMTRAVRAAEEAAAAARGAAEEPAGAEPQTLPRTEERVRDALHAVV